MPYKFYIDPVLSLYFRLFVAMNAIPQPFPVRKFFISVPFLLYGIIEDNNEKASLNICRPDASYQKQSKICKCTVMF